jgi:hypothetical protein
MNIVRELERLRRIEGNLWNRKLGDGRERGKERSGE